jgi:hypothetical protein
MLLGKERALLQGAGRCLECDCPRWSFRCFLDKEGRPAVIEDAEILKEL